MRQTAKYVAALAKARELGLKNARKMTHEQIYEALAKESQVWDSKASEWVKGSPSKSMFSDSDNQPSGVVRLRVMAHPNEIGDEIEAVKKALALSGRQVFEVSDPYPNRRGIGVRVYVSYLRRES
jgi:hypothetical protein